MNENEGNTVAGTILEESAFLSVAQLQQACAVELAFVVELVEEGVLELHGPDASMARAQSPENWCFSATCVQRLRTARRLQQDLEINIAGVAVILDLLDQVRALESKLTRRTHY